MRTILEYLQKGHINTSGNNISAITNFYADDPIAHREAIKEIPKSELNNCLKIQLCINEYTYGTAYFTAYIPISELLDNNIVLNGDETIALVEHIFSKILQKTTLRSVTLYRPTPNDNVSKFMSFAYYNTVENWCYCYFKDLSDELKEIFEPLNSEINK